MKTFFLGIIVPIILFLFFPQAIMVFAIWLVCGIIGMFYHFIDWYFDAWIVTTLAIIDIERNGLFDKQSKRVEYEMIDGIEYKITGVWATIFNFGDVSIDTMGTNMSLTLKDAASPRKLEKVVVEFQEKYVFDKSFSDYNSLKTMLSSMLAYHSKHGLIEKPVKGPKNEVKAKQKGMYI
ncbi:MAG: PH domain-containing protein [Candidatus Gracilibacteria bacterium]